MMASTIRNVKDVTSARVSVRAQQEIAKGRDFLALQKRLKLGSQEKKGKERLREESANPLV